MASKARSSAGKILNNSVWYGLETVLESVIFFGTSIVVARALGPDKLGYFSYINLFVSVVTMTGGSGLALATRKYMSEFLALDRPGIAHSVYRFAYRYQLLGAIVMTALGLGAVWLFADHTYRVMSTVLILSIVPGVMSWVPAQANVAFEDLSKNTLSAISYLLSYTAVILLTLHFHWDLVGIASASLIGRSVEAVLRTVPLHARLRKLPLDPLPQEMVQRVRQFCLQAIGLQLLMSVVWNRSEMLFLRHYCTLEQMGFYSVSAGLASKLLLIPKTFGGATSVTLMLEAGRDPGRVESIVKNASRYLLLFSVPVHLGVAAITAQAIRVAYGAKYIGAVPALVVASLLALPLAFQEIPETLLRTADRQRQMIKWLIITGVVNMLIDWILIPRYGAVGAAWGNGVSQFFGLCSLWIQAKREYTFRLPRQTALRILLAGLVMAAFAFPISQALGGRLGVIVAVLDAAPVYVVMVKLFHGLEPSDRVRMETIGARLPGRLRSWFDATVTFVTPAESS